MVVVVVEVMVVLVGAHLLLQLLLLLLLAPLMPLFVEMFMTAIALLVKGLSPWECLWLLLLSMSRIDFCILDGELGSPGWPRGSGFPVHCVPSFFLISETWCYATCLCSLLAEVS